MAAPLPTLRRQEGKRCYQIPDRVMETLASVACSVANRIPGVCTLALAGITLKLEALGWNRAAAETMAKLILQDCCPTTQPPLDPPLPTDYEAGGMKPPSQYGIPTPLVGGCNCDHSEFVEESMDGSEVTGNVGTYRP